MQPTVSNSSELSSAIQVPKLRGLALGKVRAESVACSCLTDVFSLATGESVCSIDRFKTGVSEKHHRAHLFEKNPFQVTGIVNGLVHPFHINVAQNLSWTSTSNGMRCQVAHHAPNGRSQVSPVSYTSRTPDSPQNYCTADDEDSGQSAAERIL